MPQASTTPTFKRNQMGNPEGVEAIEKQSVTVEYLAVDPTDLATTSPRIWVNTTSGILKYTYNAAGTPVKTVTAT